MKKIIDREIKKIAIRMPNWLGDFVMATALIKDLKEAFPKVWLTAVCSGPLGELLKGYVGVDQIIHCHKKNWIFQSYRNLADHDALILLTNSFSSAWQGAMSRAPIRIGYKNEGRSWLLTHPVPFNKNKEIEHQVNAYKHLLTPLGIKQTSQGPHLDLLPEEKKSAWDYLQRYSISEGQRVIGIHPGAAYGTAKCWLPERFIEVAKHLLVFDPQLQLLFFGDQNTKPLLDEICSHFKERVVNLAGKTTLRELLALMHCCDVFLTNDSGPMHMADALRVPVVALFGSTSPIKTAPFYQKKVIKKEVSCSPCYKRVCPIDFRCMKGIEAQEVLLELFRILSRKENA